jgi:hypothetical protein
MVTAYNNDADFQSLIISGGDLVSDGNNESYWDSQFFAPSYNNIQKMLGNLPYQSCIGNHEGTGVLFKKYFPYPYIDGRYWSFDYGPAHFVVVDQYTNYGAGSAQLTWIQNDLAATSKPWKFIYLHEPGWSAGGGHSNNTTVQNYIQPLCQQYGVPIVFGGHNHYYARAVVNNIQHITTGGGGAPLYQPILSYPNIVTATMANHYCKIEINRELLRFTALTSTGAIIDSLSIENHTVGIESETERAAPKDFILYNSFPNPFNPITKIAYQIQGLCFVTLKVYDVLGNEVATLVNEEKEAGYYSIDFNASSANGGLPSGVYFYQLRAGDYNAVKKMSLLK